MGHSLGWDGGIPIYWVCWLSTFSSCVFHHRTSSQPWKGTDDPNRLHVSIPPWPFLYRLLGTDKLVTFALNEWLGDIKKNQLPSILGGVGPLHSLVQLGTLIAIPYHTIPYSGKCSKVDKSEIELKKCAYVWVRTKVQTLSDLISSFLFGSARCAWPVLAASGAVSQGWAYSPWSATWCQLLHDLHCNVHFGTDQQTGPNYSGIRCLIFSFIVIQDTQPSSI